MLARILIPAALLVLTACAAAMPGYSPPPFKEKSKMATPLESGDVRSDGNYEMSATEKAMDCKRLTGSMQIVMARLRPLRAHGALGGCGRGRRRRPRPCTAARP